jgi:hypothetical protein
VQIRVANILKNNTQPGSDYTRPSGLLGPVRIVPRARLKLGE